MTLETPLCGSVGGCLQQYSVYCFHDKDIAIATHTLHLTQKWLSFLFRDVIAFKSARKILLVFPIVPFLLKVTSGDKNEKRVLCSIKS